MPRLEGLLIPHSLTSYSIWNRCRSGRATDLLIMHCFGKVRLRQGNGAARNSPTVDHTAAATVYISEKLFVDCIFLGSFRLFAILPLIDQCTQSRLLKRCTSDVRPKYSTGIAPRPIWVCSKLRLTRTTVRSNGYCVHTVNDYTSDCKCK